MNEDALVDLLDTIADADDPQSKLRQAVSKLLICEDAAVRRSAARALAVLIPAEAIKLISDCLPNEGNKFVRAQFNSSISTAIDILQGRK